MAPTDLSTPVRRRQAAGAPTFRERGQSVESELARLDVPGVAVGVFHKGREQATGLAVTDGEHPLPVDGDALVQIGATAKTFTGTVAMMLVAQGKLDLDAPLRTHLPRLRLGDEQAAARVTMRHQPQHTAGWVGDDFDDSGAGAVAPRRIVTRLA